MDIEICLRFRQQWKSEYQTSSFPKTINKEMTNKQRVKSV